MVLEEQISSHGGLGAAQTEPFLLAPAHWARRPMDLESPEALHGLIRRELARYRPVERRAVPRGLTLEVKKLVRRNLHRPGRPVYISPPDCPVVQRQDS